MSEIRPKTRHTKSAVQLRALREVLKKFNERALQIVEKDPALLTKWNVHEPNNVKTLRKEFAQRSRRVAFEPEKRMKHYAETGEKQASDGDELKVAILAAILQYHNQLLYERMTGAENWEL